jgi:hypothetical protein
MQGLVAGSPWFDDFPAIVKVQLLTSVCGTENGEGRKRSNID